MQVICDNPNCKYSHKLDFSEATRPGPKSINCLNTSCRKKINFLITIDSIRVDSLLGHLVLYYEGKEKKRFPIKHGKYVFGRSPEAKNGEIKLIAEAIDKEHGVSRTHFSLEVQLLFHKVNEARGQREVLVTIKDENSKCGTAISKNLSDDPQCYLRKHDEVYLDFGYVIYLAIEEAANGELSHRGYYKLQFQAPRIDEITKKMARI